MYVAITRARRRLYLTFAQSRMLHGQSRYNIQSRFHDEIPPELLQWLSPQRLRARAWSDTPSAFAAAAPKTIPQASGAPQWRIGQSVRHAKFGVGVIIDSEGRGRSIFATPASSGSRSSTRSSTLREVVEARPPYPDPSPATRARDGFGATYRMGLPRPRSGRGLG